MLFYKLLKGAANKHLQKHDSNIKGQDELNREDLC